MPLVITGRPKAKAEEDKGEGQGWGRDAAEDGAQGEGAEQSGRNRTAASGSSLPSSDGAVLLAQKRLRPCLFVHRLLLLL